MKRLLALLIGLLPAACQFGAGAPHPHYVVGAPYQAQGMWHYPRARMTATVTGLAGVQPGDHSGLTADGEAYDPAALAAASPDLQLPAIARVTDLATGRQLVLRINDRGPANPARILALTPAAARALGVPPGGVAPVRLRVLPGRSLQAAAAVPGGPRLRLAAAPVAAVASTPLGPPGATPPAVAPGVVAGVPPGPRAAGGVIQPALSGRVRRLPVRPVRLWVRLLDVTDQQAAARLTARLAGLHPVIAARMRGGAEHFLVRLGPFATPAPAEAALRSALAAGIADPTIEVTPE